MAFETVIVAQISFLTFYLVPVQPVLSRTPRISHSLSLWNGFFISLPSRLFLSYCLFIFLCELSHLTSRFSFVCLCVSFSYCLSQGHKSSVCLYGSLSVSASVKASFLTSLSLHINVALPSFYLQWCRQLSPSARWLWRDKDSSPRPSGWRGLQRRYQSVESQPTQVHATQCFQDGCCGCVTYL